MRAWIIVLVVLLVAASVAMAAGRESAAPTCPSQGQAAGPAGAGMAETTAPTCPSPGQAAGPAGAGMAGTTARTCPSQGQAAGPAGAGMAGTAAPQPEEIMAGGMVILRLRATVAGRTPSQRMGILYERLNGIVSDRTLKPGDYRAVQKGKDWAVFAGSHLFVTVTNEEAKANGAKPTQLAASWAQNLRKAVAAARPIPLPWEE